MAGAAGRAPADVYTAMQEEVRQGELITLYQRTNNKISGLVKVAEKFKPSGRLVRIPNEVYVGGTFGVVNMAGGDVLTGSGGLTDELKLATKEMSYTWRIQERTDQQTQTSKQAVMKAVANMAKKAMREMQEYEDILFAGNGSGKVTGAAASATTWASGAKTVYTFTESTDFIGVNRLREGQVVYPFDSTDSHLYNSSAGATAQIYIEKINRATGQVYLSHLINADAGGAETPDTGDYLTFYAVDAASFGGDFTGTPPNTTDAVPHGYEYFNDSGTSTYVQGKLKSDWPQHVPTYINGTGSTYNLRFCNMIQHLLAKRFGDESVERLVAVMPLSQADALQEEQQQVSVINAETTGTNPNFRRSSALDGPRPKFTSPNGIKHFTSYRGRRNRVDFLAADMFVKAERLPITRMTIDGQVTWQALSSTAGRYAYAKDAGFHMAFDWGHLKPGCGAYIDGLSTAAGYLA